MSTNVDSELNISRIYLMLGASCNFHCKYCLQCDMKEDTPKAMTDDVKKFIWRLVNKKKNKLTLMFWGGEPLLYFNQIQSIVDEFKDSVNYSMVSNGSLLTDYIVDFINENKINYVLSNDGVNTNITRLNDVLQDSRLLFLLNKIERLSVDATVSAYNMNFLQLLSYWNIVLPKAKPNFELLRVTWNMPSDLYNFDFDLLSKNIYNFFSCAIFDLIHEHTSKTLSAAMPYINTICKGLGKELKYPNCSQTDRNLNIDLDGNIFVCHNTGFKIGTILDDRNTYLSKGYKWYQSKKIKECEKCSVVDFCSGGCPLDITDKDGEKITCKINRLFYENAVRAIFDGLLHSDIDYNYLFK